MGTRESYSEYRNVCPVTPSSSGGVDTTTVVLATVIPVMGVLLCCLLFLLLLIIAVLIIMRSVPSVLVISVVTGFYLIQGSGQPQTSLLGERWRWQGGDGQRWQDNLLVQRNRPRRAGNWRGIGRRRVWQSNYLSSFILSLSFVVPQVYKGTYRGAAVG